MAITNAQQYKQLVNPPMKGNKRPGYRGPGGYQGGRKDTAPGAAKSGPVERGGGRDPMRQFDDPNTKAAAQIELARRKEKIGLGDKTGLSKLPLVSTQFLNLIKVPRGNEFATQFNRSLRSLRPPTVEKDRNEGTGIVPYWAQLGFNSEAEYLASLQEPSIMEEETLTPVQQALKERGDARRFVAEGGIMDLDAARQELFLGGVADAIGKGLKKVTRGIKKIAKSPIGKAALLYAGTGALGNLAGGSGLGGMFRGIMKPTQFLGGARNIFSGEGLKNIFLGKEGISLGGNRGEGLGIMSKGTSGILGSGGKLSIGKAITAASLLPLFGIGTGDESEEEAEELLRGEGIDIAAIRANPDQYLARRFAAEGGIMRQQYQEGSKEPVAKKTMPLLDMDGMEKDYREDGGFVPIGRMEKADDVPARLSKNEFVFTADAVRNAGDGDIDKGAEVMYNMMKNLEAGGEVSEESQGLEGAREMFQTSRRLEEVL